MNCLITAMFSFTVFFVFFVGAFSLVSYMNSYRTNEDDELIPRKKFIIISALIIAVLLTANLSSACFLDNNNCPTKQTCLLYEKVTARSNGSFVKGHYREHDGKCEFYKDTSGRRI